VSGVGLRLALSEETTWRAPQVRGFEVRVWGSGCGVASSLERTAVSRLGLNFAKKETRLRISGLGFGVSIFGIRDSGFGIRDSGFRFRVSGFGIRVSCCGLWRHKLPDPLAPSLSDQGSHPDECL